MLPVVNPSNIPEALSVFIARQPPFTTVNGVAAVHRLHLDVWSVSYTSLAPFPSPDFQAPLSVFEGARRLFQIHAPLGSVLRDVVIIGINLPDGLFNRWQVTYSLAPPSADS